MSNYRNPSTDRLFNIIKNMNTAEECYAFFEDLCTVKEIKDMAQRLDTAFLLEKGLSYHQITEQVGTSAATISRVSRALNYGAGGYKAAIEKAEKETKTDAV